ncbi:MAG: single-stranded DNA-binding protein [Candidatus Shapirobacteria bacterium]
MAQRSLNKVLLIGNLTRDVELRYTPQGTAVCTFGLATNRSWSTDGGERKEDVEFHRIVAWNKLAELCAQLLFKGRKVFLEGRLRTRRWSDQAGVEHTVTEVVASEMMVLDSKRNEEAAGESDAAVSTPAPAPAPAPADDASPPAPVDTAKAADDQEIEAKDIPF